MTQDYRIFNRSLVRARRQRAGATLASSDFLFKECAERLAERLEDITRTFPRVLELGAHDGYLAGCLPHEAGRSLLVQTDLSHAMIAAAPGARVVCDEEWLPFADASFDLVISAFSLHWINDLPGTLIQIHRILKPGGLLLLSLPGVETLKELRQSFEQSELALSGGLSPRVSPFVDARDGAGLLQRAGFAEPVADSEQLTVQYRDPMTLLTDLRRMGETNALHTGSKHLSRPLLAAMLDYYRAHFTVNAHAQATFEIVTLTGWKNDAG